MASTRASISKVSKRPKINIIPPKQLFVDLTQDDIKTPSPKLPISSPSAPNAPSKTPSTKDTSSSSIDYIPKSPTSSTSPSPHIIEHPIPWNLLEAHVCGSDTRPPMLDRADFECWQQRIVCMLGKDNGNKQHEVHANENRIMMERFIQPNNVSFGNSNVDRLMLSAVSNTIINLLNPLKIQFLLTTFILDSGRLASCGSRMSVGRYNAINQGKTISRNNAREMDVAGNVGGRTGYQLDDDVDDSPVMIWHSMLGPIVLKANECDAFDSDVDEGLTTQTMFMANLTSEDPIYDEAGPSYDSNTPFEVQGHDTFEDHMDEYHEVHEMQSDVHTSTLLTLLVTIRVIVRCTSRLAIRSDMVANDSVTSELARYKELVREYEKRAKLELTVRRRK
ncbi:hypothetical protein Tco_0585763 [Tanacetum coccineum]